MRIASLSPAATEILFALGKGSDVVCTDQFSNFPEEAKALPHLAGHQKVDVRELRRFHPDIVLTGTIVQERLAGELRAANFTVIHQDPRTLVQVLDAIQELGILFEREERAAVLCQKFRQEINGMRKKAKFLPKKLRVYVEEWPDSPFASGNWVPECVTASGGIPFPIAPGTLSREVSLKEVQSFDPDLIVISWCGAGKLADRSLLMMRPGWGELRAVRGGQVRVIDDALLNRPGPRLAEGVQRLYAFLFEVLHGASAVVSK